MNAHRTIGVLSLGLVLVSALPAHGDPVPTAPPTDPPRSALAGESGFAPQVPVSAFARPASWLDLSRLHVSTSVSVGTGWGGRTDALQVTSFSYQVAAPLAMRLSIGNSFGAGNVPGGRGMFLEGFALAYHPHPSFQINIDYRDIRSPLQYPTTPFGAIGR
jgi:hypothetical protein